MIKPLRVGILSDSHHRKDVAKSAINFLKNIQADILIHAGDIVEKETLKDLKASTLPYYAILGNNDTNLKSLKGKFSLFEEPYDFEYEGFKFRLAHYPYYLKGEADIFIYGHTHIFNALKNNGSLYINPGEICARKKPKFEFCYVDCLKINGTNSFQIYKVQSDIKQISWQTKEIK